MTLVFTDYSDVLKGEYKQNWPNLPSPDYER